MPALSMRADLVAQRDPRTGGDHDRPERDPCGGEMRQQMTHQLRRMGVHGSGDSPSPITIASCCRRLRRAARQTLQRSFDPAAARDRDAANSRGDCRRGSELHDAAMPRPASCGDQRLGIESGMNGVAGARVIEREVEQRSCRQARASTAERDAGRRQRREDRAIDRGATGSAAVIRQERKPRAAGSNSSTRSAGRARPRART